MAVENFTGLASIVLLIGFSFLFSPYIRTQFDFGRAAIQKLLFYGFLYWVVSAVLYLIIKELSWFSDIKNFVRIVINLVKEFTGIFFKNEADIYYKASVSAVMLRIFHILGVFVLHHLLGVFSGKRNEYRKRKKQYKQLFSRLRKDQGSEFKLRMAAVDEYDTAADLKVIMKAKLPYQWLDVLFRYHYNSNMPVILQKEIMPILINKISDGIRDESGKNIFQGMEHLIKVVYKNVESFIKGPFIHQDIKRLTAMAWEGSEDMQYQLYKSQQTHGGLDAYINHHGIKNDGIEFPKVIDNNPQPSLVAIHMQNGRIYVGWVVNSAKPISGTPEFTILPYVTKHRTEDKNSITSITKYEKAVWELPRNQVLSPIVEGLNSLIVDTRSSNDFTPHIEELKSWVETEYFKYIYRSNGVNYEVAELLRQNPGHARKFFKSIKLTDVEMIHPYDLNISESLFEHVQPDSSENSHSRFTVAALRRQAR